jgi:hypothetical protein
MASMELFCVDLHAFVRRCGHVECSWWWNRSCWKWSYVRNWSTANHECWLINLLVDRGIQPGGNTNGLVTARKRRFIKDLPLSPSSRYGCGGNKGTRCKFDGGRVRTLVAKIKDEVVLWARADAKGLRVVLSPKWDVHGCIFHFYFLGGI